jgi:hypothetical protein
MSNDALIAEGILCERYGADWDLYRNPGGGWTVKLQQHYISGENIIMALRAAVDFVQPPEEIPPMPELLKVELFTTVKGSGHWRLQYDGRDCGIRERTKKAALQCVTKLWNVRCRQRSEWLQKYGSSTE